MRIRRTFENKNVFHTRPVFVFVFVFVFGFVFELNSQGAEDSNVLHSGLGGESPDGRSGTQVQS